MIFKEVFCFPPLINKEEFVQLKHFIYLVF